MSGNQVVSGWRITGLVVFLLLSRTQGLPQGNGGLYLEKTSTVKAVPLEEDDGATTESTGVQEEGQSGEEESTSMSMTTEEESTSMSASTEQTTTMEASMEEDETTSTGMSSAGTTKSTTMAWAIYGRDMGRAKRESEKEEIPIDEVSSPSQSPIVRPLLEDLVVDCPDMPESRWDSKDKIKLLNVRPAFVLPSVNVTEAQQRSKNKKGKKRPRRHKRGTWSGGHPSVSTCGGTFHALYGIIKSPEFPLYYPNRKSCLYDIEVPENYSVKLTCSDFSLQGGDNCTHDYILVSPSGDLTFDDGEKHCGVESPVVISNGSRLAIKFVSDDLFRYQGFNCRFRAIQANGIAVIGTFGNTTESGGSVSSNFLQAVQGIQCSNNIVGTGDGGDDGTGTETTGINLYGGLWNGRCGNVNKLPPLNRIVGGYATAEHQFPWMAAVLRQCDSEYCHICGGTIISEEWILTGAHCMAKVPIEEMGVLVGDHNLYDISNDQKFIPVKQKVVHPDYNVPTPLNNDIGLLQLAYPIVFSKSISPLCLPALGETGFGTSAYGNSSTTELDTYGLGIVGQNATVLGWGMINDDGVYSDALRGVEVEIFHNDDCNRLYGIMTETMMCTSGDNGRGTCYGDSGGPALVMQEDGSYVQVGILSFGALAGCEDGYPSGQVLVHKFIDWIQSITGLAFGAQFGG